ncbi:MAG: NAD-dependent epimerase/dehydratase family protein [bacterium]|nr:NAD-dependent epimerase/dehydratase family protein [bacterium]
MKICVTGGAGFIGSNLAELFLAEGHDVVIVDNFSCGKEANIPDGARTERIDVTTDALDALFEKEKFDAVSHHAGQIELRTSVHKPLYDAENNILGSIRVLDAAYRTGVRHVTLASSAGGVYGIADVYPATEATKERPISPYGVAKRSMELYAEYYSALGTMKCVSLRYTNVYGPRQNPFGEAGVIGIVLERWLSGKSATINGDGEQRRDYVHVADVSRANLLVFLAGLEGTFNVCTGTETSVNNLVAEMQKSLEEVPTPIERGPSKAGDPPQGVASFQKLKNATGWAPEIDLADGIRETVEWFRKQPR